MNKSSGSEGYWDKFKRHNNNTWSVGKNGMAIIRHSREKYPNKVKHIDNVYLCSNNRISETIHGK